MRPTIRTTLLALALSGHVLVADDWPQWLGPERDSVWRENKILEQFPTHGPVVRWRVPIGGGYSGPAVAKGRLYVMDRQAAKAANKPGSPFDRSRIPGSERVLCLDAATGKQLWQHEYDCPYTLSYPAGPRTTPAVTAGKVYTLGAEGNLLCLDAKTGRVVWSRDFKRDFGIATPLWGFAGNPLLDGHKLICLAGGDGTTAVAFDKDTGKELWRALSAKEPGYSSPMICQAGGQRQLILWHPQALNSLNPETGALYWSEPGKANAGMTIATPRQLADRLYVSSFYNGSVMMRLDPQRPVATKVWQSQKASEKDTDALHCVLSTPFLEGGYIYGVCSYGQLRCLKAETGERVWETFAATTGGQPVRWGNAFLVKHRDRFFLFNEQGDLIIARLTPKGYAELSRAHLLEPANRDPGRAVVWSHPAFAQRCVFARNDKEILCASLAQ
jgi:outer membrane protein assembly factor BamB